MYAIGFCPRSGYEYRMADSLFEISLDGTEWQTVYTGSRQPAYAMQSQMLKESVPARYVRYRVPDGAPDNGINHDDVYCCNIAEIELYGLHPSDELKLGDVDMDGSIGVTDVITLQKFLLHTGNLPNAESADICKDGIINIYDFIMLKRLLLNSTSAES